jgi:deoxyribonuclease V
MEIRQLHAWDVAPDEAIEIQQRLAGMVIRHNEVGEVRHIAGVDLSTRAGFPARAAVVVLTYPELAVYESGVAELQVAFPYVPGLLSFREAPAILAAFERLSTAPDLVMVDGQGIAHPRRFGIASHLGILLDLPTIGCAKSRLVGKHADPGPEKGDWTDLVDRGEVVGAVVRTKRRSKPLYLSIGHKIDLATSIEWVLRCVRGYRLPEPTRQAHLLAGHQPRG